MFLLAFGHDMRSLQRRLLQQNAVETFLVLLKDEIQLKEGSKLADLLPTMIAGGLNAQLFADKTVRTTDSPLCF